jgi:hypothetical protein
MTNPHKSIAPVPRGFALIITLMLMVLLVIVAVGLLTLSSISLRNASNERWAQEARQNARLALMLAIGELQATTGPDQRITAAAGIRGTQSARPHLTGVWEGWKWDGTGNAPDFSAQKQDKFLRWLVSTRDEAAAKSLELAVQPVAAASQATLVRGMQDTGDRVDAEVVAISGNAGSSSRQGFAWAVFDESTKLPLALPESEDDSLAAQLRRMAAAPIPGYAAVTTNSRSRLGALGNQRLKLISTEQAALVGVTAADRRFHDLTSRSAGLAVDVAKGGLSVDLSRLFNNRDSLPSDYAKRHLYSGTDTPLAPIPDRFQGANPFPSPDPSWRLLHSHYRLYDTLTGGQAPTIATTTTARPPAGSRGATVANHAFFNTQQIAPVIAKAQFVFSIGFGWHENLTASARPNNASLPESQRDHYITWLVVDPVITLWNPYNVNLRFTGGRIDLYRVPLAFRLYKNGTLINQEFTHLANSFLSQDFQSRGDNRYYRLNLLPEQGKTELILAPGEHVVLSAANHVKHFNHAYQVQGLDLRPGFNPPAGNSSNRNVGGSSSLNICVSSTGANSGSDYGRNVRSIAVKPGDVIQVEVRPQRAQVDKPAETGGKEISGFLKYYTGPPASPRLVGGIEFDYGNDERNQLPSFARNDMPAFVVSAAIPRNVKADDYQGSNPPPVVRFKEPFLISSFQLKTERDSKFPSRSWVHNSPVNLYASAGLDQTESWTSQQYEFQWEVMTDWPPSSPTVEISNTGNRGYGGAGIYAQSGVEFATHSAIPLAPALSIPQFRHAPLNTAGQLPLTSQIVANSLPSPLMPASSVLTTAGNRTYLDHSYFANSALFDHAFLSGLAEPAGPLANSTDSTAAAIAAFFDNNTPLPNSRFIPYSGGRKTPEIVAAISAPDGHLKTAAHLLIDCPFNVNSTRVDVWEALLASTFGGDVPIIDSGRVRSTTGDDTPVMRHLPGAGPDFESQVDPVSRDLAKWNGHRRLDSTQIRRLAEEIVKEVMARGPFQSLAEFVNRRPGNGELAQAGALQAALERAGINDATRDRAFRVVRDAAHANPTAAEGNTADGAPGVISQAELLTPIAPILTARGDTFRIRAYGEAGPPGGAMIRVWCEAVVQRVPEFVDPTTDEPWVRPANPVNQRFGRRYEIVSFRWLSAAEL